MFHYQNLKVVSFNKVHTQTYGGYINYLKMLPQMKELIKTMKSTSSYKEKTLFKKLWVNIEVFTSLFFSIIFKPLKSVYSQKKEYVGEYTMSNKILVKEKFKVKKFVTHNLFGVKMVKHRSKVTEEDINYIME